MRRSSRLPGFGWLAIAALVTGCDHADQENGTISVVANSADIMPVSGGVGVAPTPPATAEPDIDEIIKHDRIERDVSTPPPAQGPTTPLRATPSDFTPPSLPPELLEDGGLKPLPTRRAQPTDTAK